MSNLRSDCRDLVADLPAGDVYRSHIERLCYQIDEVEERWLAAERNRQTAEKKLQAARKALENIVCTVGQDRGVILLDHEGRTQYDKDLNCQVYLCENFSPLGDALIDLWKTIDGDVERVTSDHE